MMKVVILAGGFGTRLSEYTGVIPKPMVPIGGRPMLWHIMNHFAGFGYRDFYIALGYKGETIKEYFLNYYALNADFTVDLASGAVRHHGSARVDWRVTLVDTGPESMTGGRVKRMQRHLGNERFLLTYGDGVADVDLDALIRFHAGHGKLVTVTAVHPGARFGQLSIHGDHVREFSEKPQTAQGWINGGFFVIEPAFLDFIEGDGTVLEREPLERAAREEQLMAYRHEGFWHCVDTKRDYDLLQAMWEAGNPPWIRGRSG